MSLSASSGALIASVRALCFIHSLVTLKETVENKHAGEPQKRVRTVVNNHRLHMKQLYQPPSECKCERL